MASSEESQAHPGVVGECYRVERELGRGGMARVYAVIDERTGERLALKKLFAEGDRPAAMQAMFEHEYHTLVQLAHPRIVRVFEYGLDAGAPFFTMELLDGADARTTARKGELDVGATCLLLRDAASALALIHSRRLLHRDLGPRNLWCLPDGRAKLIDFGTLAPMGAHAKIAGTAPFVPPEALHAQALDARSDLYALGALGYYMLTRRNAYPARHMRELRQLWQRKPAKPHALRPDVPEALSELVMSLLSLDPRGRPGSAAEVCARLTAIGGLPAEDERGLAQAFLTTPTLVGRDDQNAFVRARLLRMLRGRGNAFSIVGEAGMGLTRMLESAVLSAKLMGATVVRVDAGAAASRSFGLAIELADRLLEALPANPGLAPETSRLLASLSPALKRAYGKAGGEAIEEPHRSQMGAALRALFEATLQEHPIVLAVDEVNRADSESHALLASLMLRASAQRLVIAVTCEAAGLETAPPALARILAPEHRVPLLPLELEGTQALLSSVFGNTPYLDDAARYLHEVSQGSPKVCMQYAQYLVDQNLARYEGGRFKLPASLRDHELPATLTAMLEQRIRGLSPDAFSLALGFALARDETRATWQPEQRVHVEDHPALLDGPSASARAFRALGELLRAGLVEPRDQDYVLGQAAIADALFRLSDEPTKRRMHARLAGAFARGAAASPVMMVRQLQLAGDYEGAQRALLAMGSIGSGFDWGWGDMRISVSAHNAQRQLAWWQAQGGKPSEGMALRRIVLAVSSVYDWELAHHGDAHLAQLSSDLGLSHWDALDAALSPADRIAECMRRARESYEALPAEERCGSPELAVRDVAGCAMSLSGAYANSHDILRARGLAAFLERLRPLGNLLELLADIGKLAADRVSGHAAGERVLGCAQRLYTFTGLPVWLRQGGAGVYLHVQALEDARCGRKRALELMDLLARSTGDAMMIVVHSRFVAFSFRGQAAEAAEQRRRLEQATLDDAWRRRAYLFVEAQLHALTGDLVELLSTTEAITELAARFPGWRPWHAYARSQVHRLRGELDAAQAELERALREGRPGEHRAYVVSAPAYAEILLMQGQAELALRQADRVIETVNALTLDPTALVAAERIRAFAHAALGAHDDAAESLRRAFALAREQQFDGLPLALLYEARARLALAAREPAECLKALTQLRGHLEHAEAPALIGAYESLREEAGRQMRDSTPPSQAPEPPAALVPVSRLEAVTGSDSDVDSDGSAIVTAPGSSREPPGMSRETLVMNPRRPAEACARLSPELDRSSRATRALELLLADCAGERGHLLLFDMSGVTRAASIGLDVPSDELLAWAQRYLELELSHTGDESTTGEPATTSMPPLSPLPLDASDAQLVPVLLSDGAGDRSLVTGLLLVLRAASEPIAPTAGLVRAVSRRLLDAGDSVPFVTDL